MTTYQPVTSPARNHTQLLAVGRWFGFPSPERDSENDSAEEIGLPDAHYRRSVLKMGGPKELETPLFQVLVESRARFHTWRRRLDRDLPRDPSLW
jgi:hypothetical protein